MTTYAEVPLAQVQPHPNNVRRSAVADDDMVASVASSGIHEPVLLGPEVDGIRYLIAGNRRYDAAVKAGLTEIPALLRDDLATEAQQIEVMLVENLHRQDLTAVEEADAYEQLQLFGMDAKAIAAATGRSVATVKQRLTLGGLSTKAKESVHDGELSLTDAAALLEFDDDPETLATLEENLGTSDFGWRLQQARSLRAGRIQKAELAAAYAAEGIAQADESDVRSLASFWTADLRVRAGHSTCLAYVVPDHGSTRLVCSDPESHAAAEEATRVGLGYAPTETAEERAARDAAHEEAREAAIARRQEMEAQRVVKAQWIANLLVSLMGPALKSPAFDKAVRPLVAPLVDLHDVIDTGLLLDTLGIERPEGWNEQAAVAVEYATSLQTAKKGAGAAALAAVIANLVVSSTLTGGVHLDTVSEHQRVLAVWDFMTDNGYTLSSADSDLRAQTQQGLDELLDEDAA